MESVRDRKVSTRTMTLNGQGQVTLVPDMAVIRLGVELTGSDLEEIQSRNAEQTQAVLDVLRGMGIEDIKTFQFTIDKYFENDNGTQVDRGFRVRNILEIRTQDLDQAGALIDTAVSAGANVVDLISFELSDPERYYLQALNLAVDEAIAKARSIASEIDLRLDPTPVSITETGSAPRPSMTFRSEFAATPVVPGNLAIEANVTAEFTY